ncbi:MAG: hypothetical protein J3R72DRAFT_122238 [Linnemannia gamsii]|nr:MAG: hypothetical protein J3R72DRAFT_122238 [Linnemannia gamsii]
MRRASSSLALFFFFLYFYFSLAPFHNPLSFCLSLSPLSIFFLLSSFSLSSSLSLSLSLFLSHSLTHTHTLFLSLAPSFLSFLLFPLLLSPPSTPSFVLSSFPVLPPNWSHFLIRFLQSFVLSGLLRPFHSFSSSTSSTNVFLDPSLLPKATSPISHLFH